VGGVGRGRLDSDSFLACYMNDGRIDAVVGFNRREVHRALPLIKARHVLNVEQLRNNSVDRRTLVDAPQKPGPRASAVDSSSL
jgi:hypothetical protein